MTPWSPEGAVWRKSSRSANGSDNDCVETDGKNAFRDSKNPSGGVLVFSREAYRSFIDALNKQ
ncbi:DUF397 domain-containing protein [Lentzea guizhouensis]|uniref:DUF397 domain-containing protein n=1 Tax=Lentzea guizhouensis TaxID=1586287 RepID=UPI0008FF5D8A|nr:DUF397 domain-containing protein [Lentzea guizhouensis]